MFLTFSTLLTLSTRRSFLRQSITAFFTPSALPALTVNACLSKALDTIWAVESGRQLFPPAGDSGKAIGPFQIHRLYWIDGTKALGVDWPFTDACRLDRSQKVVCSYLLHYYKRQQPLIPYSRLLEFFCRTHNGGPFGFSKPCTLPYWLKCQQVLKGA